jgi:alkylhydroperoxidase/carboxymuconolactone decarboxylase family protein YurZ
MKPIPSVLLMACLAASPLLSHAQATETTMQTQTSQQQTLSARQQAILPITAFTASGDMPRLNAALERGLDDGLTISDAKEVLVQMYAYTGFPRSLNALSELMKVLQARKARGITDAPGTEPAPLPAADDMLAAGTANQTQLVGQPVSGPLFEFSPQIDRYLKEHLFGAIFARDNLGWPERELATLGALAALPGVESQLASHMRVSRNVGLSEAQLEQVVAVLRERVDAASASRAEAARKATTGHAPG